LRHFRTGWRYIEAKSMEKSNNLKKELLLSDEFALSEKIESEKAQGITKRQ